MKNSSIKLIATDLDGTLLRKDSTVSEKDYQTFIELGKRNICRVAATGRSLYSTMQALDADFPIDYLIFSTGAGILNWKTKEMVQTFHLESQEVEHLSKLMYSHHVCYSIHPPIPDTHFFWYYDPHKNSDLASLLERYAKFSQELDFENFRYEKATQLRAILPNTTEAFEDLKKKCDEFAVIRATSPISDEFVWLEVFHPEVSKGKALNTLCQLVGIEPSETLSVGNDYNDIDMLEFTAKGFMLDNAVEELKQRFNNGIQTLSHMENGFSHVVEMTCN